MYIQDYVYVSCFQKRGTIYIRWSENKVQFPGVYLSQYISESLALHFPFSAAFPFRHIPRDGKPLSLQPGFMIWFTLPFTLIWISVFHLSFFSSRKKERFHDVIVYSDSFQSIFFRSKSPCFRFPFFFHSVISNSVATNFEMVPPRSWRVCYFSLI